MLLEKSGNVTQNNVNLPTNVLTKIETSFSWDVRCGGRAFILYLKVE